MTAAGVQVAAALAAVFAGLALWSIRRYLRESVEDYAGYIELCAGLVFTLLAIMSLVALTVGVSAAGP